jgi:hypothetical protein
MAILIGLAVAGVGVLFIFAFSISGRPAWLNFLFQNGLLVVGAASLAICAIFGYSMGLKRLYAYGLLSWGFWRLGNFWGFFAYLLLALELQ